MSAPRKKIIQIKLVPREETSDPAALRSVGEAFKTPQGPMAETLLCTALDNDRLPGAIPPDYERDHEAESRAIERLEPKLASQELELAAQHLVLGLQNLTMSVVHTSAAGICHARTGIRKSMSFIRGRGTKCAKAVGAMAITETIRVSAKVVAERVVEWFSGGNS